MSTLPDKKEALVAQIINAPGLWNLKEAHFIHASQVVIANWPRVWCHLHCPYAHHLITNPPSPPNPEQMTEFTKEYRFGLFLRCEVEADKPLKEQYVEFAQKIISLEEELREIGYPKAFCVALTSCLFAPAEVEDRPCDYPHKSRPTFESVCIDIPVTLENINWDKYIVNFSEGLKHLFALLLIQ